MGGNDLIFFTRAFNACFAPPEEKALNNPAPVEKILHKEFQKLTQLWKVLTQEEYNNLEKRNVQQIQRRLLQLYHRVENSEKFLGAKKSTGPESAKAFLLLKEKSVDLLHHIHICYPDKENLLLVLPATLQTRFLKDASRCFTALHLHVKDDPLLSLLLQGYETAVNDIASSRPFTWQLNDRLHASMSDIEFLLRRSLLSGEKMKFFIQQLCVQNMNHPLLLNTIIQVLEKTLLQEKSHQDALKNLQNEKKELSLLPPALKERIIPRQKSMVRLLIGWLNLKMKEIQASSPKIRTKEDPIITSLSRRELGLLIVLFFKTGVFINHYRSTVVRFMSRNVRSISKREEEISEKKLYNDMNDVSIGTIYSMERILKRMLLTLEKLKKQVIDKNKGSR